MTQCYSKKWYTVVLLRKQTNFKYFKESKRFLISAKMSLFSVSLKYAVHYSPWFSCAQLLMQ